MGMEGNDYCSTVTDNPEAVKLEILGVGGRIVELRESVAKCGLDLSRAGTCEGGNEVSGTIKCEECLEC